MIIINDAVQLRKTLFNPALTPPQLECGNKAAGAAKLFFILLLAALERHKGKFYNESQSVEISSF